MWDFAPVKVEIVIKTAISSMHRNIDGLEDSSKQSNCTYHSFSHLFLMQNNQVMAIVTIAVSHAYTTLMLNHHGYSMIFWETNAISVTILDQGSWDNSVSKIKMFSLEKIYFLKNEQM